MTDATLDMMRDVIRAEAQALQALVGMIDAAWAEAADVLHKVRQARGRIIVCGVGKSGHVGRKIAATMASTGAPAFFVHGAEASHGDLGMVTKADAVIMLSASGKSHELMDMAEFCRRGDIPLILISKRADSPLGQQASIVLRLPDLPETGPLGLAPTTSSTMSLAAGDALAMALMRLAGFTAADFAARHPGGALGQAAAKSASEGQ
jgi:arabinose-5-phosphate isomerase